MKLRDSVRLIIAILGVEFAGIVGSLFTAPAIDGWYRNIVKPVLNPPAWVFGPVWTTLFALMGISVFLLWSSYAASSKDKQTATKIALVLFGVQLALNTLWSMIFFGLRSPGAALIEIVFLWFAIVATMIAFARISKPAAWLLVPYILWVSFAAYLNYAIWILN